MLVIKALGIEISSLKNAHTVKSKLSKARRALKGNSPNIEKSLTELDKAIVILDKEINWRLRAEKEFYPSLKQYQQAISQTIGLRMQERLTEDQAKSIASCLSEHKDISLNF